MSRLRHIRLGCQGGAGNHQQGQRQHQQSPHPCCHPAETTVLHRGRGTSCAQLGGARGSLESFSGCSSAWQLGHSLHGDSSALAVASNATCHDGVLDGWSTKVERHSTTSDVRRGSARLDDRAWPRAGSGWLEQGVDPPGLICWG